jgi:hypothetical protein
VTAAHVFAAQRFLTGARPRRPASIAMLQQCVYDPLVICNKGTQARI